MATNSGKATKHSPLLHLPAELRLRVYEHLNHIPGLSTTSVPHRAAAYAKGFTSGVGHVTMLRYGEGWRSVSIAKPPGFACLGTSILRTCRLIHTEAMDLLYDKILWVINIQSLTPIAPPFAGGRPAVTASPGKPSIFLQSIKHVHIRQHIRPEEDLLEKALTLKSLLACINSQRKTTELALHFDSIHLVNDSSWPNGKKMAYAWQAYEKVLSSIDLGRKPQIKVSDYWLETEGQARFEKFAARFGG